jgi:hypothetical protein
MLMTFFFVHLSSALGAWVGTQRTNYRNYMKAKEKGQPDSTISSMNEERINQLNELGFVWSVRSEDGDKDDSDEFHDEQAKAIEQEALKVAGSLTADDTQIATDEIVSETLKIAEDFTPPDGFTGDVSDDAVLEEAIHRAAI